MHQQQDPREQGSTPDVGDLSNLSQLRILIPSYRYDCNSSTYPAFPLRYTAAPGRPGLACICIPSISSPLLFRAQHLHLADYLLRP
jgi:hypothetical protein